MRRIFISMAKRIGSFRRPWQSGRRSVFPHRTQLRNHELLCRMPPPACCRAASFSGKNRRMFFIPGTPIRRAIGSFHRTARPRFPLFRSPYGFRRPLTAAGRRSRKYTLRLQTGFYHNSIPREGEWREMQLFGVECNLYSANSTKTRLFSLLSRRIPAAG